MSKWIKCQIIALLIMTLAPTPQAWAHNPGLAGNHLIEAGCVFLFWVILLIILWRKSSCADSPRSVRRFRIVCLLFFIIPIIAIAVFYEPLIIWILNI